MYLHRLGILSVVLGAIIVTAIEFHLGPYVHGGALFLAPVALSAWYLGPFWGSVCSVYPPIVRFFFYAVWETPWPLESRLLGSGLQIAGYLALTFFLSRVRRQVDSVRRHNAAYRTLLGVCDHCMRVRTPGGSWELLSEYTAQFATHDPRNFLCTSCSAVQFPKQNGDGEVPPTVENG